MFSLLIVDSSCLGLDFCGFLVFYTKTVLLASLTNSLDFGENHSVKFDGFDRVRILKSDQFSPNSGAKCGLGKV
jgi:hypothetical protein